MIDCLYKLAVTWLKMNEIQISKKEPPLNGKGLQSLNNE